MPALPDESHFAAAANEYDAGRARAALVAMAEAQADGDPARTRAGYVRARAAEFAEFEASMVQGSPAPEEVSHSEQPDTETADSSLRPRFVLLGLLVVALIVLSVLALVRWTPYASALTTPSEPVTYAPIPVLPPEDPPPAAATQPAYVEPAYVPPPPPPPRLNVVQVKCDVAQPDMDHGLVRGLTEALTADVTLSATVTVRNNGGAGEVGLVAWMEQTREPLSASRSETLHLESGEERALSFYFPEYVSGADASCYAQSDPSLVTAM